MRSILIGTLGLGLLFGLSSTAPADDEATASLAGTRTWASMRNGVWMSWITKLEGMEYPPGEDYSLAGADVRQGSGCVDWRTVVPFQQP